MGANIWNPASAVQVNADTTLKVQKFTATAGQTTFTLTNFSYAINTSSLMIFRNGIALISGTDFAEVDANTFSLTVAANVGDIILAQGFVGVTATVTPSSTIAASYYGGAAAGTGDVETLSISSYTAYNTGDIVRFLSAGTNTGAVTLNINSIAAIAVLNENGDALVAGDIVSGAMQEVVHDGTSFRLRHGGYGSNVFFGNQSLSGNLTFTGSAKRILGDFSNATDSSRLAFKSSTTNGGTWLNVIPNGTATTSRLYLYNSSDPDNAGYGVFFIDGAAVQISTSKSGTGTALPIKLYTNGILALTISTAQDVTLASNLIFSATGKVLQADLSNATASNRLSIQSSTVNGNSYLELIPNGTATVAGYYAYNGADKNNGVYLGLAISSTQAYIVSGKSGTGSYLPLIVQTGGSTRLTLDTSGRLGIGVTPYSWGSSYSVLDLGTIGSIASASSGFSLAANSYINGNWIYKTTAPAALLQVLATGQIVAYTAASGTAGTTISWGTARLTIDVTGNIGIGVASSAWAGTYLGIDIGTVSGIGATSSSFNLAFNAYHDASNWIYKTTTGTSLISMGPTGIGLYTAANGTAGASFSWTQQAAVLHTASAVNYLTLTGAATGGSPTIAAAGADTNISLYLTAKGTGGVYITDGNGISALFASASSAVNYLTFTSKGTGGNPNIVATGSDTNISVDFITKGNGAFTVYTNTADPSFQVSSVAGAVNYLRATPALTANPPYLAATGSDTNISLDFLTKGAGGYVFATNGSLGTIQLAVTHTASAVNYLSLTGAAAGSPPIIAVAGSDTNLGLRISTKGTGSIDLYTNGNRQVQVYNTASAVNYLGLTGAATGGSPVIETFGSDVNVGLTIATKGTGSLVFAPGAISQAQVLYVASAVNYVTLAGSTTTSPVVISTAGSDAVVPLIISTKGGGAIYLSPNGLTNLVIPSSILSIVNYFSLQGSTTGTPVTLFAAGSDANVGMTISTKGTGTLTLQAASGTIYLNGTVKFGTYTAGAVTQAGYVTIVDSGGTTRRLLVG